MAWMLPAAGLIGGLYSSITQHNDSKAATAAADAASQRQNELEAQQLAIYQSLLQDYQKYQQPLQAGVSGQYGDELAGNYGPDALQEVMQFLLHPESTQLSQQGQAALKFYMDQAQNGGIDPRLQQNALGQQQQGFDQQLHDIRNMLGGTTNLGSLEGDLTLQNDQQRANLIAQMTGQSQQLRDAAMGKVVDTAGLLDTQRQGMLSSAAGLGAGVLSDASGYIQAGKNAATGTASGIGGLASNAANAASSAASNAAALNKGATNPFSLLANSGINFSSLFGKGGGGANLPYDPYGAINTNSLGLGVPQLGP